MPITTHSKCPKYGHPIIVTVDDDGRIHAEAGTVDIPRLADPEHPDQEPISPAACPSCLEEVSRMTGGQP